MESFDYEKMIQILKSEFQNDRDDITKMYYHIGRFIIFDNK